MHVRSTSIPAVTTWCAAFHTTVSTSSSPAMIQTKCRIPGGKCRDRRNCRVLEHHFSWARAVSSRKSAPSCARGYRRRPPQQLRREESRRGVRRLGQSAIGRGAAGANSSDGATQQTSPRSPNPSDQPCLKTLPNQHGASAQPCRSDGVNRAGSAGN